MATFDLAREGFREITSYPVAISRFETSAEQRRLRTNKANRRFEIQSPNLTETQMQVWSAFYEARSGSLEDFEFENPKDSVTYTVRFDGEPEYSLAKSIWRVKFTFITCDEDEDA